MLRAALLCALSAEWAAASGPARLIISEVECIAVGPGDASGPHTVVIEDGRVSELHPGRVDRFRLGDLLVRGAGLWLIPGLIDAGVGPARAADLQLVAIDGVTTVVLADAAARARFEALARNAELPLPRLEIRPPALAPGSRIAALGPEVHNPELDSAMRLVAPAIRADWAQLGGLATPSERQGSDRRGTGRDERAKALAGHESFSVASGMMEPFVPAQWALQRELEALQELKLRAFPDAASLLSAVTRGAADALGREDLGRIAVGSTADFVVLEADPRLDLAALRRVRAVVLRGRLVPRSEREMIVQVVGDGAGFESRVFASALAWSDWPDAIWRSQNRIVLDGLPRGIERTVVRRTASGFETLWQQELWPPLSSVQSLDARHDSLGRLVEATLIVHSIRERLLLRAVRTDENGGWRLESTRDRTTVEGVVRDPPSGHGTIMFGPIPGAVELFVAVARVPARISGFELDFGSGAVSLLPLELTVTAAVPLGADSERLAPGTIDPIKESTEPHGGGLAATPARGSPLQMFSIREGSTGSVRASFVTGDSGWPRQFAYQVPFGLWEIHPMHQAPQPEPSEPAPSP